MKIDVSKMPRPENVRELIHFLDYLNNIGESYMLDLSFKNGRTVTGASVQDMNLRDGVLTLCSEGGTPEEVNLASEVASVDVQVG